MENATARIYDHLRKRSFALQIWDDGRCICRCHPDMFMECSTGYTYDPMLTCSCLPSPVSLSIPVWFLIVVIVVCLLVIAYLCYANSKNKRRLRRKIQEAVDKDRLVRPEPE